jgi:hypothetical protein
MRNNVQHILLLIYVEPPECWILILSPTIMLMKNNVYIEHILLNSFVNPRRKTSVYSLQFSEYIHFFCNGSMQTYIEPRVTTHEYLK